MAEQNEAYLSRLQVIDLAAARQLEGSFASSRSLRGEAVAVARMIPVYVEVAGDSDGRLKVSVEGVFTGAGFRTSDVPMKHYTFKATASFVRRDTDSSVQCLYSLEGNLTDKGLAEVLLPLSLSGREASNDFVGAKERAVRSLEAAIKKGFAADFAEFVSSIAAY